MPMVKCGVDGCSKRLQPLLKVDPRDRDTWFYPECERCGRPVCEKHSCEIDGQLVCDVCRRKGEAKEAPVRLIELGTEPRRKPGQGR